MVSFEDELAKLYPVLERFVKYKLNGSSDSEDVIQEVCLTAYLKYGQLINKGSFKPWVLSIARNKCTDHFRKGRGNQEVSLEEIPESRLSYGRRGWTVFSQVEKTMARLNDRDREILTLFYWRDLTVQEIADHLKIPGGTVKSRLNTARNHFRDLYPNPQKESIIMTKLPEKAPKYMIEEQKITPFSVKWEELQGWLIVPRLGEKLSWGLYEQPSGKRTEFTEMEVVGKASIHGIDGVEIRAVQYDAEDYFRTGSVDRMERKFIAQLTDTHCRYLAESHVEDGVRKVYTFLDGEEFLNNWGFGEDNCGNETNLSQKRTIVREGNRITANTDRDCLDIVGRYQVTINGKSYDTVCVMDIQCFNDAVASEQYVDQTGRTVLWRRFNRDDWAMDAFGGKLWSEKLPENQRLIINGATYVHWYDCISDYIL